MSLTSRANQSVGGPRGGTTWSDDGGGTLLAQIANSTTPTFVVTTTQPGLLPLYVVSRPNPFVATNATAIATNQDVLDSTAIVQTLYGFQVAASVLQAATVHLTMALSVYRTIGQLSATGLNGTSITLKNPLTQALPNSASLTATKADGSGSTTVTLTAAAPAGATVLTVTSVDLTLYLVNSYFTYQVGGASAFGWTAGAAAGTPAFPLGGSVVAPINTANTAVVTTGAVVWNGAGAPTAANSGMIPLQAGDLVAMNVVTDSATVTAAPLCVQLFIT